MCSAFCAGTGPSGWLHRPQGARLKVDMGRRVVVVDVVVVDVVVVDVVVVAVISKGRGQGKRSVRV